MEELKINHVGYLINDLEKSLEIFINMGYCKLSKYLDNLRGVEIAFIKKNDLILELIRPIRENSAVSNLYKKIGPSPYHVCYETFDLDKTIADFRKNNWIVVVNKQPAIAFGNLNVVFLFHKEVGLIELLEVPKNG